MNLLLQATQGKYTLFALALFLPLILFMAVALVALRNAHVLRSSHLWVEHTLLVREDLDKLLGELSEIESGQRGFVLTDREEFLDLYTQARTDIPVLIQNLRTLTRDNPRQQAVFSELQPLVQTKLDFAEQVIALKRADKDAEALALVQTGRGLELMKQLRTLINGMMDEESRLLEIRHNRVEENLRMDDWLLACFMILDGVVIVVIGYLFLRLRQLQQIVTVCAWSKTIRYENQWISFEEYLQRRHGVKVSHGISEAELAKLFQETAVSP